VGGGAEGMVPLPSGSNRLIARLADDLSKGLHSHHPLAVPTRRFWLQPICF
jgi:hypothetical protein